MLSDNIASEDGICKIRRLRVFDLRKRPQFFYYYVEFHFVFYTVEPVMNVVLSSDDC